MHNNLMINQKLNEFEDGISQLVSMNKEFVQNHKLKVIVSAHERIINQLSEVIKKQEEISKQLTIKGIVYTNMIAEKVTDYNMKFSGKLHKVKEVGSYISKNIEDCSNRLKNRFEDLRVKLADINKVKEHTYGLLCPDVDGYFHLLNLAPITKDDLLGIYSFNRDKVKDDGCRTNYVGTNKAIEKLPEIINGQEFFKWMSWNCALLNNIKLCVYFGNKSYEKMKGAGLDLFSSLQEITKTPIEAVSVKQDEWGNVVGVERKKPLLRLVIDKFKK